MKVACFTVASMDYFPRLNAFYAGGNSLNQAVHFRRMGYQTAFIGALGTDKSGKKIFDLLKSENIDHLHTYRLDGNTASNRLVNDENGERFEEDGAWQNGVYGEFRMKPEDWEYISDFEIWTTHANCPDFQIALQKKKRKQIMCVDFLHLKDYELLEYSLKTIDVAFFGGTKDMEENLARIAGRFTKPIVLTLGAAGSVAFYGTEIFRQPALPVEKVIDTTGCGDAFQAAFSGFYFKSGNIQKSLYAGAEAGRKTSGFYGAIPWNKN